MSVRQGLRPVKKSRNGAMLDGRWCRCARLARANDHLYLGGSVT